MLSVVPYFMYYTTLAICLYFIYIYIYYENTNGYCGRKRGISVGEEDAICIYLE